MTERSTGATGIAMRGLYKIFGRTPDLFLDAVRDGMTKTQLKERHDHVLGLRNVNLDIEREKIQVIMGLSGSGKSTLIRHIHRLIEPTAGDIRIGTIDVTSLSHRELLQFRREKTAMVFQRFALLPHRTVLQNVRYGLEIRGVSNKLIDEKAHYWIERVGLSQFESNYPMQLSGGMQQRVGLARALANDAPILLMDEAFSALDPLIRVEMQSMLLDIQSEIRKTVVFITHDLDEALRLGDSIAILRDGEIVQQGTSQDIVLAPVDEYIANFVKEVNRSKVVRLGAIASLITLPNPDFCLPSATTLEEAARAIVGSEANVIGVLDDQGRLTGHVTAHSLMAAMVGVERVAAIGGAQDKSRMEPPMGLKVVKSNRRSI